MRRFLRAAGFAIAGGLGACSKAGAGPVDGGRDASTAKSSDASARDAGPPDAALVQVVVDNSSPGGTMTQLDVGSNQIFPVDGLTTPAPTALQRLVSLAPALLRLHVQAAGGALPTSPTKVVVCTPSSDTSCNRIPWSFASLDDLVGDAVAAGAEPLMNIPLPPPWQWTVTNPTSTPEPTAVVTDASDPSHPFAMFASYMASLVQYYNVGQVTVSEADGSTTTLVNPSGTKNRVTWWELLNEPSLSSPANFYQPAGPYPGTAAFTPAAYAAMWNATTAAMLAVDPTVKIVGPAVPSAVTPAGQNGGTDYIPSLLSQARRPDAVSFHGYAWSDDSITDLNAYAGNPANARQRGLAAILADLHQTQAWTAAAGVPALPIWIDEFGFNGFGTTDPYGRPNGKFGVAYTATAFGLLESEPALAQMDEFSFALQAYPDLSLLDFANERSPSLLYWMYATLCASFPPGSELLTVSNPSQGTLTTPGVSALAIRDASGAVNVLLANATVASPTDQGGPGVPTSAAITVNGGTFQDVTVLHLDDSTSLDSGPSWGALASGATQTVALPGYGVAVLRFAP